MYVSSSSDCYNHLSTFFYSGCDPSVIKKNVNKWLETIVCEDQLLLCIYASTLHQLYVLRLLFVQSYFPWCDRHVARVYPVSCGAFITVRF